MQSTVPVTANRIIGRSAMADAVRQYDWASTPLGPIEGWSKELVTVVNLTLASSAPARTMWGPEFILIYNDAYKPFPGPRHPEALGKPARTVYRESWPVVGPMLEKAFATGETFVFDKLLVPLPTDSGIQEFYLNYSFNPIYEDGVIAGLFGPLHNVTGEVLAALKLSESEARASRILQSIGDAVIVTDAEACVTLMNPVAQALTGWSIEDALGRRLSEVFHIVDENNREVVESPADKVRRLGTVVGLANHTILIRKDGSEVHIDDSGAPISNADGEMLGIVLVFRDVGEKLERDKLLRDNERRLQAFVNSFPALAWTANADGWITWYNRRWYEYTGTTPEAMEGWGWQSVHDATVLPSVMERWTESISTKEPFEMVFPLRGADGVFRSFLTRVLPIKDESGTVVQWFGTNIEIDELQRTRRSLEESEAVLNQVLNATSDAVVSVNRDWTVAYMNPNAEKLYGSAKEVVGRTIWQAFPETAYEGSPFVEHYYRAMEDGIAGRFEADYGDPANMTIGLEVYPSRDGIVTFSRDITRLKNATAALLQTEKLAAVGRLASSIAHEINNPLESVTNLLYLAQASSETPVIHEFLETAERELRRVSVITNQTLRFHKQTTGPTPATCVVLFQETLSIYQSKLLNSNIQIEKLKRATKPVLCFEGEIRQVLSNLVSNAIDAMQPDGGRLLLRSRETTNWRSGQRGIALTVADTGSGMPPQVRKKVFDAFFSTKGIGGTGLGLWVSQEIVARHHGTLRVRSSDRSTSHGTVFVLFLPFEPPAEL
ncbi:MAG: PAS domain-containing protein [Acidobacteriaceae bacterium]